METIINLLILEPSLSAVVRKAGWASLVMALLAECVVWGFLDGRLKKAFSFLRPWFLLNVLAVFTLVFAGYGLTNHLAVSVFTVFLLVTALAIGQVVKVKLLGLPIFFWDYTVVKEAVLYLPVLLQKRLSQFLILLGAGALAVVFYGVSRLPAEGIALSCRLSVLAISLGIVSVAFLVFKIPYRRFFPANSLRDCAFFRTGTIPFIILSARYSRNRPAPAGYERSTLIHIGRQYAGPAADPVPPAASAPNILLYGIESLMDLEDLDIRFRSDPMPFFSSLAEQNGRQVFVSPTFGGQTVQPEFEFLTGLSQYQLTVPNPFLHLINRVQFFPALPSFFKNRGYYCLGVQAVAGHEFQRRRFYPVLGFDRFKALETDYPREDQQRIHHLLADQYLIDKIAANLPTDDQPVFGVFFTNSTHAAYTAWERNPAFTLLKPDVSARTREVLERYAGAIHQADQALERLVALFQQRQRPTIIFFFGDHLPGLSHVFEELGSFQESRTFHRFHTPLRIWSSFPIDKRDRIVSANLLPALLLEILDLDEAGLPLPLKLVKVLYRQVDVFSHYIRDKEGRTFPRSDPPKSLEALARTYDLVQYDLLEGNRYLLAAGDEE